MWGQRCILAVREDAAQVVGGVSAVGKSRRRANSLEQDAGDRALCGQHLEDPPLAAEPQQVIPGQTESADEWHGSDTGMRWMPVVAMHPVGKFGGPLS